MTETITPQRFHEADGVEDWRVLTNVAHAHFRTGSFSAGVAPRSHSLDLRRPARVALRDPPGRTRGLPT
jgi:hypothetical protein